MTTAVEPERGGMLVATGAGPEAAKVPRRLLVRLPWVVGGMVLSLGAIALLALWGESREARATLEDLGQEQATVAAAASSALANSLRDAPPGAPGLPASRLFRGLDQLERPGAVHLFLLPPGRGAFVAPSGQVVDEPQLHRALMSGQRWVQVGREAASRLGLPPRLAIAGLAWADAGAGGRWGVVVAATAWRERDRSVRARWMVVATLLMVAAVIGIFGSVALRLQAEEFRLARALEARDQARRKDSVLSDASRAATVLTFAAGVAHEISSPLGVITGRAEQLLDRFAADERTRRGLETILEESQRISATMRRFLHLARGGEPAIQALDPRSLALASAGMVAHRFQSAGVELTADVPGGLPQLHGDGTLLEQALVNLLLNACDACAAGGHVRLGVEPRPGMLEFVIEDDGHGVRAELAARLTEPFFTTKPSGRGHGLGLAITQEILKMHRGCLAIEPRGAGGTRVRVRLPAV
ncbi:MAG TPA: HAMP domain-containing sensor histidine kinase [Thermoanaerobaculia bacterium]|nr:HAMP domain-containing sensor histidine kinase [Thermoanaerobaculia bacterium]